MAAHELFPHGARSEPRCQENNGSQADHLETRDPDLIFGNREWDVMLSNIFGKKTDPAVVRLYDRAVAHARQPVFYRTYGVADTLDGRFEMIVLHVCPLIDRLRDEAGATLPFGQALFDTFVKDMEGNLRTIGVGDISIPKKMKKIGESFYGRLNAYRHAVGDDGELAHAIARNVLDAPSAAGSDQARALARYYAAMHAAASEADDLLADFAYPAAEHFVPAAAGSTQTEHPVAPSEAGVDTSPTENAARSDVGHAVESAEAAGAGGAGPR